ncbi:MAG: 4Fe-4S dicluster domain-containing protein [Bacteroidales bacterium]|jgi:heterodisulfide reductase subunit C/nitrate reductase gamma subunit|nr:4Fe-4S dicluster domain-containing protein [Bacteroidales bacterium]
MTKQIIFSAILLITLCTFAWTIRRLARFFKLTQPAFPVKDIGKRMALTLRVAFGQSKIFRWPFAGLFHALVFWGFIVITLGSIEMVIDGLSGTERIMGFLGPVYDVVIGSGDVFAAIVLISILVFIIRRVFHNIKRFKGTEIKRISTIDAYIALTMILFLMISLLGMNIGYVILHDKDITGVYPVSQWLAGYFAPKMSNNAAGTLFEVSWWVHIILIFIFANILPYSKHFHVFTSIPNVFLSRLEPLGYLPNMENVMNEVRLMINPEASVAESPVVSRFGVKDAEDVNWKNYLDSLACTECGRCTAVCPANITGKKLSPRKIFIDLRARMKEKGPGLVKNGKEFTDNKSLLRDYITEEELWACTTCNACAQECPININHPTLIMDMRRYLVMEEAAAPAELNMMFTNIENNGAPWQRSQDDRLLWAEGL